MTTTADDGALRALGRIAFTKMSGSGNDFIVIDDRAPVIPEPLIAAFTRLVCRRRLSVGADGVVLIQRPALPGIDFRWRYINADGSEGEMCGNGAMCGARFAVLNGIAPASCAFETVAGTVRAEVGMDGRVRLAMPDTSAVTADLAVDLDDASYRFDAIAVGVPHAVLTVDAADAFMPAERLAAFGRAVRYHPVFAQAGTNVNVIHRIDDHALRMRTYERGVEAETLACGTGAVASAVTSVRRGIVERPVRVLTSGGRWLEVDFTWDGERACDVRLTGEASVIATGEIWEEALR